MKNQPDLRDQINDLIETNETSKALDMMEDRLSFPLKDKVSILKSEYTDLTNQQIRGTISYEDFSIGRNRIHSRMQALMNAELQGEKSTTEAFSSQTKPSRTKIFALGGGFILIVAVSLILWNSGGFSDETKGKGGKGEPGIIDQDSLKRAQEEATRKEQARIDAEKLKNLEEYNSLMADAKEFFDDAMEKKDVGGIKALFEKGREKFKVALTKRQKWGKYAPELYTLQKSYSGHLKNHAIRESGVEGKDFIPENFGHENDMDLSQNKFPGINEYYEGTYTASEKGGRRKTWVFLFPVEGKDSIRCYTYMTEGKYFSAGRGWIIDPSGKKWIGESKDNNHLEKPAEWMMVPGTVEQ